MAGHTLKQIDTSDSQSIVLVCGGTKLLSHRTSFILSNMNWTKPHNVQWFVAVVNGSRSLFVFHLIIWLKQTATKRLQPLFLFFCTCCPILFRSVLVYFLSILWAIINNYWNNSHFKLLPKILSFLQDEIRNAWNLFCGFSICSGRMWVTGYWK